MDDCHVSDITKSLVGTRNWEEFLWTSLIRIHTLQLQEHSENYPQTITKEKDDSFKASLVCFKETTGLEIIEFKIKPHDFQR
jgi:hypothetical protein